MNESLTIAIPFFNEEEVIANLYNKLNDVLHSLAEDREVHLLLINDGSTDKTEELLDNFFAGLDNCEILKHDQNRNLDGFLKSCIENCKTDLIVFLELSDEQISISLPFLEFDSNFISVYLTQPFKELLKSNVNEEHLANPPPLIPIFNRIILTQQLLFYA